MNDESKTRCSLLITYHSYLFMKPERWHRVERLYHSTLGKKAGERAAFLADACAGDAELRREVESLLAYEGAAENFIDSQALEVAVQMMGQGQEAMVTAGQTINQYKIVSPIGAGGMGEVYLAQDTRLNRKVAIKILPELFTGDKVHLRRFEQEARAVAALSHPNVCTIHEVIETTGGRHCIVMEYVEGVTLRQHLVEGPMKVGEALDAAIQVASAISAAHAAGIVHRDIKTDNLMLRRDGYVKVLDFGLAKLIKSETAALDTEGETRVPGVKTSPGILMGTVAYMSPEQARGLPLDARTDIWSLGVVLYEIVSGRKPFEGQTPTDVIISVAEREPAPLTSHAREAPVELERIVTKALTKDRDERYQTADELLTNLKALKRGLEISAEVQRYKPASSRSLGQTIMPVFPWLTRARGLVIAGLIGVLILAGLVYARFYRRNPLTSPPTGIKSLAVLPLTNVSGDSAQDYFAYGITDVLINELAKVDGLRVLSRASVIGYKGAQRSPAEIGNELKVDAVVTGSVARSGDRVRVAVQLTHVPSGRNLWSEDYDPDLREMLTFQAQLRRDVAEKIGLKNPLPQAEATIRPVNAEAYDHHLRGRFYSYRQTREDNQASIAALEKAVAADPNFATAHADLAQAYVWKLFLFAPGEKQLEEKAFVEVEKALALDPNSAVAYLARGRLLWTPANHFPHDRAIKEYQHALALNPTLEEARNQLALVYCHIGAFAEAHQESQLALLTDPNNNLAQFRIAQTLNFEGKYDEALTTLRAIPRTANPALVGQQTAWSLFNLGKKEEASVLLEQLLKEYPDDTGGVFTSIQAVLAASAGHNSLTESKIKSAIEKGKGFGHFHHTAYHVACAYALMNKPGEAIKWLEAAAADGFPCYRLFETDQNLNNLRRDPRFATLLSKLKANWEYYKTIL